MPDRGLVRLELVDLAVGAPPLLLGAEALHALHQHAAVIRAVEDAEVAGARAARARSARGSDGVFSSPRGAEKEETVKPRGSRVAVTRLMAPPLPAASQPSKTASTGTCRSYIRKCSSRIAQLRGGDPSARSPCAVEAAAEVDGAKAGSRRAHFCGPSSGMPGVLGHRAHERPAPRPRAARARRACASSARWRAAHRARAPAAAGPARPPSASTSVLEDRRPASSAGRWPPPPSTGRPAVSVRASISSTASSHRP